MCAACGVPTHVAVLDPAESPQAAQPAKFAALRNPECRRYLGGAVYSTPSRMARLFGLEEGETVASLGRLGREGRVRVDREVAGWPGRWVIAR